MQETSSGGGLELRDYLDVLRRRKTVVILTTLLVVALAVAVVALQEPVYESTTRVVVSTDVSGDAPLAQLLNGDVQLDTQIELISSLPVATLAAERLEGERNARALLGHVEASQVGQTEIVEITASASEADRAAAIANAFAEAFLEFRTGQALDQIVRANEALDQRIEQIEAEIDNLEAQLSLGPALGDNDEPSAEQAQLEQLQAQLLALRTQQATLSGGQDLVSDSGQIVQPAGIPDEPVSPKPLRTGVLGLILGLSLGIGLAFLRDHLDDTIRSEEQARRIAGAPVLGRVPRWRDKDSSHRIVSAAEPTSPVSEAYRTLRTQLRFLTVDGATQSFLVTSPQQTEGKTTTVANLGFALAQMGARVIVVDADLRRSRLHHLFGMGRSPGLSDVLVGELPLWSALVETGIAGLSLLPSGASPPNPSELIGSAAMRRVMDDLEEGVDYVLYDAPPLLAVADSLELAGAGPGVLLVVDTATSHRHALAQSVSRLREIGTEPAGLVLNNLRQDEAYTYYYQYRDRRSGDVNSDGDDPERSRTERRRDRREAKRATKRRKRGRAGENGSGGQDHAAGRGDVVGRRRSDESSTPSGRR